MQRRLFAVALLALAPFGQSWGQVKAVTRADVIASAIARGARFAVARADSSAAGARLALSRQYENPALVLDHTRDTPRQHVSVELPLFVPVQRSLLIRSAGAVLDAAALRTTYEREAVAFDADTTYTWALVARERALLSARSARDADSLVTLAGIRRDAGDGSELDVQLAMLNAGQFANAAALDSLDAASALLSVQAAMGLPSRALIIALADTLDAGPDDARVDGAASSGTPLLVSAAQSEARASELSLSLERRRVFTPPTLSLGFERQDPGGAGNQFLPTFGLSVPLPLLNRNRGGVLMASADRDRASAELLRVQVELATALSLAERERAIARERLGRSRSLIASAERVAALSLLAYREGASALPSVLEAQRSSREIRLQFVEALGAHRTAAARVRLLALTSNRSIR